MDQLDHVASVIAIKVCKVNQKLLIKIDFCTIQTWTKESSTSVWYEKSISINNVWLILHTVIAVTDVRGPVDP